MDDTEINPVITLPAPYLEAVGALITNAAVMELLVDHMIAVFLRTSPTIARRFTNQIKSTKSKLIILKAIHDELAHEHPELITRFDGIYQKLTSSQANRSKIAHAKWGAEGNADTGAVDPIAKEFYIVSIPEGEEEAVTEPILLRTLQGYATQMAQAHRELEKYLRSLSFRPGKQGLHRWPPVHDKNIPAGRKQGRPEG